MHTFSQKKLCSDCFKIFFIKTPYKILVKSFFSKSIFFPIHRISFFDHFQKQKTAFFQLSKMPKNGSCLFFSAHMAMRFLCIVIFKAAQTVSVRTLTNHFFAAFFTTDFLLYYFNIITNKNINDFVMVRVFWPKNPLV